MVVRSDRRQMESGQPGPAASLTILGNSSPPPARHLHAHWPPPPPLGQNHVIYIQGGPPRASLIHQILSPHASGPYLPISYFWTATFALLATPCVVCSSQSTRNMYFKRKLTCNMVCCPLESPGEQSLKSLLEADGK